MNASLPKHEGPLEGELKAKKVRTKKPKPSSVIKESNVMQKQKKGLRIQECNESLLYCGTCGDDSEGEKL